jgi:hypothetical protein
MTISVMPLSITPFSITVFNKAIINDTFSIMTLETYPQNVILAVTNQKVMLSVHTLSVITLSVVATSSHGNADN